MPKESQSLLMAAIDIGASAIRLDVAEVRPEGSLRLIESLKKGVQLGKDTFSDGHISEETIRAACEVLRDFKRVMDTYGVVRYHAVATSAVRESVNSETFLDRVLMNTGLDVEIIDPSEENRLTLLAVTESIRSLPDVAKGKTLLVEVGGGSADVTFLNAGEPLQSGTFPIGSIRMRAEAARNAATPEQQVRLLKRQISNLLASVRRSIDTKDAEHFVALGGDIRFAARMIGAATNDKGPPIVAREAFAEFVDSTSKLSVDALVQKFSISYMDAETLTPALLTYAQLLKDTQARNVIVSDASIRAGILQDLLPAEQGKRMKQLEHQILSAARSLGRKYRYEETHAEKVREIAAIIFDELRTEQRMGDTHRLYLQVAALLHDIGSFIGSRGHHKHSYYLIAASGLFGLRQRELEIIANIARYHRRSLPQRSHVAYVSLDRDDRMTVSKLAAILRVANALDKERLQKITNLKVVREDDKIVLLVENVSDLTMERASLAERSDFFCEVFGKQIVLREADKPA